MRVTLSKLELCEMIREYLGKKYGVDDRTKLVWKGGPNQVTIDLTAYEAPKVVKGAVSRGETVRSKNAG